MVKKRNFTKKTIPYKWPTVAGVSGHQPVETNSDSSEPLGKLHDGHDAQSVRSPPLLVAGATEEILQFNKQNASPESIKVGEEETDIIKKDLDLVGNICEDSEEAVTRGGFPTVGSIGAEFAAEVGSEVESMAVEFNSNAKNTVAVVTDFVGANESQSPVKHIDMEKSWKVQDVLRSSTDHAVCEGVFDNESCNFGDYGSISEITVSSAEDGSSVTRAAAAVELTVNRNCDMPQGTRGNLGDDAFGSGYIERSRQETEDFVEKLEVNMIVHSAHERGAEVQETRSESLPVEPFSSSDVTGRVAGLPKGESMTLDMSHLSRTELMRDTNGEEYEVSLVTNATMESPHRIQDAFRQQVPELRQSHGPSLTFRQLEDEDKFTALCTLDTSSSCESYGLSCSCRPWNKGGEGIHETFVILRAGSKKEPNQKGGKLSQGISETNRRNALGRYKRLYCQEHRLLLYGCQKFVALRTDLKQGELATIPLWRICRLEKLLRKFEPVVVDGRDCHFATNHVTYFVQFFSIPDDDDLFVMTYQPVLVDMLFDTEKGALGVVYDVPGCIPLLGYFPVGESDMYPYFQSFLCRIIALALGRKPFSIEQDSDQRENLVDFHIHELCHSKCFLEVFPYDLMVAMKACQRMKKLKICKQKSLCTGCHRLQRSCVATTSVELSRLPHESDLMDSHQPQVCHEVAWIFCASCVKQLEAIHKLILFKFWLFMSFRVQMKQLYSKLQEGQKYVASEVAQFLQSDSFHNKRLFYEFLTAYYGAFDAKLKIEERMKEIQNEPQTDRTPVLSVTEAEPSVEALRSDCESLDANNYVGTSMGSCEQLEAVSQSRSKRINSGKKKKILSAPPEHSISSKSVKVKRQVDLKTKTENNDLEKCGVLVRSNSLSSGTVEDSHNSKVFEVAANQAKGSKVDESAIAAAKSSKSTRRKNSIQRSVEAESQADTKEFSGCTSSDRGNSIMKSTVEQAPRGSSNKNGSEVKPETVIIRRSARKPKKKQVFSPERENKKVATKTVVAKTLLFGANSVGEESRHIVKRSSCSMNDGCKNFPDESNRPFANKENNSSKVISTSTDKSECGIEGKEKISKRRNRRPSLIVKIPLVKLPSNTKLAPEYFIVRQEANKKVYQRKSKVSLPLGESC